MLVDERYFVPRTPISVIAIGDSGEALLVRSVLESLGAAVLLHLVGTPLDFLLTLQRGENDPKLVVVCGHGDENGFVFGEYDEPMGGGMLIEGALPPIAIRSHTRMAGASVFSTACLTGSDAFSSAFLDAGAAAYIASPGYPEGADAPLFVHLFFHALLTLGLGVQQAFDMARGYHPIAATFSLFRRDVGDGCSA